MVKMTKQSNSNKSIKLSDGFYNEKHPYGVLPAGNAYLCSPEEAMVRPKGLGLILAKLTDEALIELLAFLNANELSRCSACSRAFYVYAHHSDLWRDLTLRRWEGTPIEYQRSWKETYMIMGKRQMIVGNEALHQPISVRGVYSNLLHRAWACHSCDLATACPGFFKHCDVERSSFLECNVERFISEFESRNKPLVLTGAVDYWPALHNWTEAYLVNASDEVKKNTGKEPTFRATSATAPVAASFTLRGYFNYLNQAREEAPLYLFERDFVRKVNQLGKDYDVPVYFRSPDDYCVTHECENHSGFGENKEGKEGPEKGLPGTDLFRILGSTARPDHRWLICGPKRSGSIFHIDPNQTNAWNVCLQGRKKWIFYPPGMHPPGVVSSADGADVTVPISTGEWLLSFWKMHLEARNHPDPLKRPLEVIVNPGEIVFVPHSYWHMVVNLDDCIALTHNYVSTSNLADCLRFLRDTPDQISGVRDRAEAITPECMFDVFTRRLEETGVIPADQLRQALARSEQKTGLVSVLPRKRKAVGDVDAVPAETFNFSFF